MKYIVHITGFLAGLLLVNLQAQKPNQDWHDFKNITFEQISKRNIGPAATSGRITAIAVPQQQALKQPDRNTIYIGAASGGIWKSTNAGLSWKPIFDEMDVQSIGALAVDPLNPDVIWAGTGEGNPRNSHNSGKGIYRSLDAGKTWKCMGLEKTRNIHRIVINPQNSNEIFVGAFGNIWGPHQERGVFRSRDGGNTWERVLFSNEFSGCAELILDPQNPKKLFAALYDHQRQPWTFRSGGAGSGLYMSLDGGTTWKKLQEKDGLPSGELGRIGIAIPKNNPNRVYALIEAKKSGFYRSEDGGFTWKFITDVPNAGNRPFYYHEIYAHPVHEDRVFSIWSQVSYSRDAGEHWDILADWGTIHPDHHAFLIHPEDPDYIINGNDGGIAISYDGGKSWRFAENIPVGQFYHIDIDQELPYHVYGGLQDNGSWVGPAFHWKRGPIKNHEWREVLFGDGFDVAPVPNKPGEMYAMWQGGNVYHINTNSQQSKPIKPQHPEGKHLRFNWNAAMAVDPHHADGLYFGSQYLHYSPDKGETWQILSPDLTTNDSSKLQQAKSGGLTVDATGAENHCSILSIAIATETKGVLWVGTDDGNLQLSTDGGKNWQLVTPSLKGSPKNAWIPYLWVSPKGNECWVVMNNYRQNDWNSYVYRTRDFGKTWELLTKPESIVREGIHQEMGYVHCVLPHPDNKNLLFLGSDRGLWVSFTGGTNWYKWTKGFPSVPVSDLKFQRQHHDLVVGTFGRGVWVFDDIRPLERLCEPIELSNRKALEILHVQEGYLANFMGNNGQHYQTAELFGAPNKNTHVSVHLWLDSVKISPKKKIKLVGEIYDSTGTRIRKHHFTLDKPGYHRINWRMIADGIRFPTHANSDSDSTLPEGWQVAPGTYTVRIRNEGDTLKYVDSRSVEVRWGQQHPWNNENFHQKLVAYQEFGKFVGRAFKVFENLKIAEINLKKVEQMTFGTDFIKKETLKEAKQLSDSIEAYKLQFMLPKDYRYYEDATVRLNDILYAANELCAGSTSLNQNTKVAIKNAENAVESICSPIETFLQKKYLPFIDQLSNNPIEIRWAKPMR